MNMKWLNYHHLFYFLKIAEAGSVSRAAVELRVGQPALSAQLKELEGQLGELFERRNRGLHLTDKGRVVLKYARDIFSRGEELLSVLDRGELATNRLIVVGVQEGVPKAIIASTLVKIHKKHDSRIRVIEGDPQDLLEELGHGRLDFVILEQELSHPGGTIFYHPIASERLALWGAEKFKHLAKDFPKSVTGVPVISSPLGHGLRQELEHFFLSREITLNIMFEAPDTALIKEMGVEGMGLVALGEATVKAWVRAGRLHKIGILPFTQKYWIGIPKRSLRDPLAEIIKKEFSR